MSDTQLDVMLDAQRRYTAKSSRKKVIDDIQRHVADQVYYAIHAVPQAGLLVELAGEELRR